MLAMRIDAPGEAAARTVPAGEVVEGAPYSTLLLPPAVALTGLHPEHILWPYVRALSAASRMH